MWDIYLTPIAAPLFKNTYFTFFSGFKETRFLGSVFHITCQKRRKSLAKVLCSVLPNEFTASLLLCLIFLSFVSYYVFIVMVNELFMTE